MLNYDNLIARKNFFPKNEPKLKMKRLTNEKRKEVVKWGKVNLQNLLKKTN